MNVLFVEKSPQLQQRLGLGLGELGYRVDTVSSGEEALARASTHAYDLIILDLMLPQESNLLVLHEIREQDREIEILVLSTQEQIHDRVTALIQGADDYLVKPFSCDELHARIQELVHRQSTDFTPLASPDDPDSQAPRYLDRLIANLLQLCGKEPGEIELVISEVKLAVLLRKISRALCHKAGEREVSLCLPSGRLPTLLVDAKWIEHLLTNLVFNAISRSRPGSVVNVLVHPGEERCAIEIESFCSQSYDLSLIEAYAAYLNMKVGVHVNDDNHAVIRLSNLKMV